MRVFLSLTVLALVAVGVALAAATPEVPAQNDLIQREAAPEAWAFRPAPPFDGNEHVAELAEREATPEPFTNVKLLHFKREVDTDTTANKREAIAEAWGLGKARNFFKRGEVDGQAEKREAYPGRAKYFKREDVDAEKREAFSRLPSY